MIQGLCAQCSQPFHSYPSQHRIFCSRACRTASRAPDMVERQCGYCGKTYAIPRWRAEAARGKYCSQRCRRRMPKQSAVMCVCEYCQQTFEAPTYYVKRGQMQFCCAAHRVLGLKQRYPEAQRFWSKVAVCEHGRTCPDCCWLWQGAMRVGYGAFSVERQGKRQMQSAHVYAWESVHGPMPPAMQGNHIQACPSRACVNPAHIYPGTKKDNTRDAMELGHMRNQYTAYTTKKGSIIKREI